MILRQHLLKSKSEAVKKWVSDLSYSGNLTICVDSDSESVVMFATDAASWACDLAPKLDEFKGAEIKTAFEVGQFAYRFRPKADKKK